MTIATILNCSRCNLDQEKNSQTSCIHCGAPLLALKPVNRNKPLAEMTNPPRPHRRKERDPIQPAGK